MGNSVSEQLAEHSESHVLVISLNTYEYPEEGYSLQTTRLTPTVSQINGSFWGRKDDAPRKLHSVLEFFFKNFRIEAVTEVYLILRRI